MLPLRVHTFPNGICPKVNVIARLEYELAYYDSAVHRFNHEDTPSDWASVYTYVCVYVRVCVYAYVCISIRESAEKFIGWLRYALGVWSIEVNFSTVYLAIHAVLRFSLQCLDLIPQKKRKNSTADMTSSYELFSQPLESHLHIILFHAWKRK